MEQQDFHLITHVLCPYVQRSAIVLQEKDIAYRRTDIDLSNTPSWFKQISPMGRVPILVVNESKPLFESAVICEYLDEITVGSLHPDDPLEKARHRSWIEYGSGILDSIGTLYNAQNEKSFEQIRLEIQRKFQLLEQEIDEPGLFSGNGFHLIDAVYGPIFRYFDVFDQIVDLKIFDNLTKVKAWRVVLQHRPSIKQAVVEEYPELLLQFLAERGSYISQFVTAEVV